MKDMFLLEHLVYDFLSNSEQINPLVGLVCQILSTLVRCHLTLSPASFYTAQLSASCNRDERQSGAVIAVKSKQDLTTPCCLSTA